MVFIVTPLHSDSAYGQFKVRQIPGNNYARLGCPEDGNTGYDLYVQQDIILQPNLPVRLKHAICVEPPEGYQFSIRPRSSTLMKFMSGIDVIAPLYVQYGTVDPSYRGELMTNIVNLGLNSVTLEAGERVSQLVLLPVIVRAFEYVDELSETNRGDKGHGSSGR